MDLLLGLPVVGFMLWNARKGYSTGRLEIGWAFERIFAERATQPFLYWFMLIGQVAVAFIVAAILVYINLFPST
jgi:hypothetical protein